MKAEIQEQLNGIFRSIFKDDSINVHDEMTAAEVESWDSLNHMSMLQAVEKAFGVKFKLKEINKMKNVGDMVALIEQKQA